MKGPIITLFAAALGCLSATAQTYNFTNVLAGNDHEQGYSVCTDSKNNIIAVGYFRTDKNFDDGTGAIHQGQGDKDIWIQKSDAKGTVLWTKVLGGEGDDRAYNVVTDQNNNILVVGHYGAPIDMDPGSAVFELGTVGGLDAFLLKLDPQGNFVWAKSFGDELDDEAVGIGVGPDQNIWMSFNHVNADGALQVDFDNPATSLSIMGNESGIICQLSADGELLWYGHIQGENQLWINDLDVDSKGNVVLTGNFNGPADFDPDTEAHILDPGGVHYDIFVAKLTKLGQLDWAYSFGSFGEDRGQSIAVDAENNVVLGGFFENGFTISPQGDASVDAFNDRDGFILKLDALGTFKWVYQTHGFGSEWIHVVDADAHGNVYATGWFDGNIDFDPTGGFNLKNSAGESDVFAIKLDKNGTYSWGQILGDQWGDQGQGLAVGTGGEVVLTGYYDGAPDMDPGFGTDELITAFDNNVFVWSYQPEIATEQSNGECDMSPTMMASITYNGEPVDQAEITVYHKSATGWWPVSKTMDGDSLVTMPDTGWFVVEAQLDPEMYPLALPTYYGGSMLWNDAQLMHVGCGTGHNMSIEIAQRLEMSGTGKIFGTVTYKDGANKTTGDPIPGLDIVLEKTPPGQIVGHTTTDELGAYDFTNLDTGTFVVKVNAPGMEQLASVDINLDEGEEVGTDTHFLADTTAGTVELDNSIGVDEKGGLTFLQIYPNPAQNHVMIVSKEIGQFELLDVTGKVLYNSAGRGNLFNVDLSKYSEGLYFVKLVCDGQIRTERLVVR